MSKIKSLEFKCKNPCNNCPYRKDAPLQLWSKEEFDDLLKDDSQQFGNVYGCHKNNGTVCRGYLMDQDKRGFPNINLRLMLSRKNVTRDYLDKLHCKSLMYVSIEEMVKANFK